MIELHIPGRGDIHLEHLVCDVNGTLALDGRLQEGVASSLKRLREKLTIHLITADTHGKQAEIDAQLELCAVRLRAGDEAGQKAAFVNELGAQRTAAIGQGSNDAAMLAAAAIGICVLSPEGTSVAALNAADLLATDILSALDLFMQPLRITATLRK
jgi:P-type E1-E2 ATPase